MLNVVLRDGLRIGKEGQQKDQKPRPGQTALAFQAGPKPWSGRDFGPAWPGPGPEAGPGTSRHFIFVVLVVFTYFQFTIIHNDVSGRLLYYGAQIFICTAARVVVVTLFFHCHFLGAWIDAWQGYSSNDRFRHQSNA
jgi:hypothetical protein